MKEVVKTTMGAESGFEKDKAAESGMDITGADSGDESKDEKNQEWKTVVHRRKQKSSKEKDDHEDAADLQPAWQKGLDDFMRKEMKEMKERLDQSRKEMFDEFEYLNPNRTKRY